MRQFATLPKLHKGDKVALLSPSFAAPGRWPHVYELGLQRLRDVFELEPVEYPTTKKIGSSKEERMEDLIGAFEDQEIKAVIASLGGDDQVTYIKNLPSAPFSDNPKPFFGYSDNTHFMNHLWLLGVPSFYGGALFTQFAEQGKIHEFSLKWLKRALFESGEFELEASKEYNDIGQDWNNPENLNRENFYEPNDGWIWDGFMDAQGISWGGCIEAIDEILRHGSAMPTLEDFQDVILIAETSEEIPTHDYVYRVYRALGERGILERVKGVLVGRPKAWEFDKQNTTEQKRQYREMQCEVILKEVRKYNSSIPVLQNLDFGHSNPQIPMPYGNHIRIDSQAKKIFAIF